VTAVIFAANILEHLLSVGAAGWRPAAAADPFDLKQLNHHRPFSVWEECCRRQRLEEARAWSLKCCLSTTDPKILAAFQRQLRKKVPVETVNSGTEGLEAIRARGPFSVVVTDYCMPEMNGILSSSPGSGRRRRRPCAWLLTGSADLNAPSKPSTKANIFRFLTKPCSPDELMEALKRGIEEYRRTRKERNSQRTRRWLIRPWKSSRA